MKNILLLVPFFFLSTFIGTPKLLPRNKHLPRIAVAGIAIESSTFSPEQTDEAAFHAHYGKDVLSAKMVPLSDHLNQLVKSGFAASMAETFIEAYNHYACALTPGVMHVS